MGWEYRRLTRLVNEPRALPASLTKGGTLVICGGGRLPDEVLNEFLSLAGGPKAKIVVVPAYPNIGTLRIVEAFKQRGAAEVVVLHATSREVAESPGFIQPLEGATGVWFGGGQQTYLANIYAGTAFERQLKTFLEGGGVVGGSSAGAAIMTRVMIAGGRPEAKEGTGFDLLPGVVVDQHFLRRNRLARLLGLLGRHRDLIGFGIDEGTALIVEAGRRLRVIGNSYVVACIPASDDHPARIEFLEQGDSTDLVSLRSNGFSGAASLNVDDFLSSSNP
jgi:cyanophycinase